MPLYYANLKDLDHYGTHRRRTRRSRTGEKTDYSGKRNTCGLLAAISAGVPTPACKFSRRETVTKQHHVDLICAVGFPVYLYPATQCRDGTPGGGQHHNMGAKVLNTTVAYPVRSIEFKNVSFGYNSDSELLHNISFVIKGNSKVGLVGKNGEGKTTLLKLLFRLYDPTSGQILVNGVDIKKYNLKEYRKLFASVMQDYQLFALPIEDNIKLCRDVEITVQI